MAVAEISASLKGHSKMLLVSCGAFEQQMHEFIGFVTYELTALGMTILIVWPQEGLGAWVRERVLRSLLPKSAEHVLDCYICLSFWTSFFISPAFWMRYHELWVWCGPLMTPAIFWLLLRDSS